MSNKIDNMDISDILNKFGGEDNCFDDEVEYSERDFNDSYDSEDEYLQDTDDNVDNSYSDKVKNLNTTNINNYDISKERNIVGEKERESDNYEEIDEEESEYNHIFRLERTETEDILSSDNSENIDSNDNIKKRNNYLSSDINIKKYYDTIKSEIKNDKNILDIEKDVINNNYESFYLKIRKGINIYRNENKNMSSLCNGLCKKRHNLCESIGSFIKRIKANPRKEEICYKNSLYYAIKNNMRGVKSIYNLLLKLLNIKYIFRMKCKCCVNENENEYLEYLDKNIMNIKMELNDVSLNMNNEKFLLELNFLINKFMSKVGLLKCECSYRDKYYEWYNENYHNYYTIYRIYNLTIPKIVLGLKALYKIKENMNELILIKESRCIHKDIINYKNFYYCKKKKYNQLLDERKQVMDIIMNIEIIHNWIKTNNKITRILYNEQSYNFTSYMIYLLENSDYEKEIEEKKNIINSYFECMYKKDFFIIDYEYESGGKNLINLVINNCNIDFEYEKIIINLILSNKMIERKNTKLVNYILECLKREKYKLGIEFINHLDNLDLENVIIEMENEKDKINLRDLLEKLLDYILEGKEKEIDINFKISYLKILYKKKIGIIRYDIINKLIEIPGGDRLIDIFVKNDNLLINYRTIDNSEYIIKLIKGCIINKKVKILDYILTNFDNQIKRFNSIKNVINPFTIYFNTINIIDSINEINTKEDNKNIFNEVEYKYLLEVICKYGYDINELYHNISYLEHCIIKGYNNSGKILVDNEIGLFKIIKKEGANMIDQSQKSLLFLCIDYKNHIICEKIINKNYKIINLKYNKMTILNYLIKSELDEGVILKFLDKLLINKIDINYQDEYNINIPYEVINSSRISYLNKIIFFSKINRINHIDPMLIHNKIPLIMYVMLKDYYEITEILLNNLINNKRIMKINDNKILKDIETNNYELYYHTNEKININFIPFIIKYVKENKSDKDIFINHSEKIVNLKEEYTIYENEYKMNILLMITLEFVCFNILFNKRNKIIIENNIIGNRFKSNLYDDIIEDEDEENSIKEETEKNKYLEISDGDLNNRKFGKKIYNFKNIILDTESMITVNSEIKNKVVSSKLKTDTVDIWNKNTSNTENTNISSEIEESDIIF